MVTPSDLLAFSPAVLALGLGILTLVSNWRRRPNQAASLVFLSVALWSATRGAAMHGSLPFFRATSALGALLPLCFGLLAASLTAADWRDIWRENRGLAALCVPLLILPWLDWFAVERTAGDGGRNRPAYYLYIAWAAVVYAALAAAVVRKLRRVHGMPRLELRVIALTGVGAAAAILLKMALSRFLPPVVNHYSSSVIALALLCGMGWVFFTRRIFDAHHLFRLGCRYAVLVVALTVTGWILNRFLEDWVPDWLLFVCIAMAILALGHWLRARLDRWLFSFPEAAAARAVLHTAARQTATEADFRREFRNIVAGWARADGADLVAIADEDVPAPSSGVREALPALVALRRLGWATPERLERERPTAGRVALKAWLTERRLGAVVVARGQASAVAVGVGLRATREPFTYPDIEQLTEFAEIAEAAMERLRLTAQIVQSEKLATVGLLGASLAHEIRNPLYAIRAFVELLPANYDRTEFREQFTGLVGSEVVRIDHLISQLMNLASPRPVETEALSLHNVIHHGCELLTPKARACDTAVETDLRAQRDEIVADAGALKQVLLNLGLNAIHAQEHTASRRWLRIATRDGEHGLELIVSDGGPGIAAELRPRLFEPFQTNRAGGLGLGLSVTREVLSRFGAVIIAEAPASGTGAVFRVTFPRPPGGAARKGAPPGSRFTANRRPPV